MADTFRDFEIQLDREMAEKFKGRIGQVTRLIGLEGLKRVVQKSPVGNPDKWQSPAPPGYTGGSFRSNWMVDLGQANERTQKDIASEGEVVSRGSGTIAKADPFQRIVLHNSLPYALPLEEGHSSQAPSGVVAVTAAELESAFRKVK